MDSLNKEILNFQKVKPEDLLKPLKLQRIDFEDLEIEGQLVKPQGALLIDRKRATFNPLIKLRTDFNPEISTSVNEVKY